MFPGTFDLFHFVPLCVCVCMLTFVLTNILGINYRPHKSGTVAFLCVLLNTYYVFGFIIFLEEGQEKKGSC